MTDQERKAMEMALEALEFSQKMGRHYEFRVVCDRCNQVINKEFERLQRERFFYGQDPNVLPPFNKGKIHE